MKKIILTTYCLCLVVVASAQINTNGTTLTISTGLIITTTDDVKNTNSGVISNLGTLVTGDFYNESTSETKGSGTYKISGDWLNTAIFMPANSKVIFDAGANSTITSGGHAFYNVEVNKTTGTTIDLLDDLLITNSLSFTADNNKISIGVNNLSLGTATTLSGFDANDFIITDDIGYLMKDQLSSTFVFPIGHSNLRYNPLSITQNGTLDNIGVRALENVLKKGDTGNAFTTDVVDVTWDIVEDVAGGSNLNLIAQWTAVDELGTFDRSAASIHQYTTIWAPSTFSAAAGSDPYTLAANGFTSVGFFAVSNIGALPVELLSFSGKVASKFNELYWKTASEINAEYFELERSEDGVGFEPIARVDAKGFANIETAYQFDDLHPKKIAYYRLRMVDLDETYAYSPIIILKREEAESKIFNLFPNPTSRMIQVLANTSEDADIQLSLSDNLGRVMKTMVVRSNARGEVNHSIDVSEFPAGVYYLRLMDDGKMITTSFVKETL